MRPRLRLKNLLDDVTEWDVILIDSPSSLGPLNDNVVLATDDLLVPVEADESSQLALDHLLRQVDTLEDNYDQHIGILGVVVSNVSYPLDNEQRDAIEWYNEKFDGRVPVWVIRSRAAIKRAVKPGGSIFAPDAEDVDMREVYAEIAEAIDDG
jgi:chromosome partitioning protein